MAVDTEAACHAQYYFLLGIHDGIIWRVKLFRVDAMVRNAYRCRANADLLRPALDETASCPVLGFRCENVP